VSRTVHVSSLKFSSSVHEGIAVHQQKVDWVRCSSSVLSVSEKARSEEVLVAGIPSKPLPTLPRTGHVSLLLCQSLSWDSLCSLWKWVMGTCNFISLLRWFILFSSVLFSYVTFITTALLPQIIKPLLWYCLGSCPHPHSHRSVPRSIHHSQYIVMMMMMIMITTVPLFGPAQLTQVWSMYSWTPPCDSFLALYALHRSLGYQFSPTSNHQPSKGKLPRRGWWRRSSHMIIGQFTMIF